MQFALPQGRIMIQRSRVVASLVAAVFLTGMGALVAAPAVAAESVVTSVVVVAVERPMTTVNLLDSTDQKPLSPENNQQVHETPAAERAAEDLNSLILVAGLGVLFAAILVVVMSGSKSHVGRD
jgi:hypothetical protein